MNRKYKRIRISFNGIKIIVAIVVIIFSVACVNFIFNRVSKSNSVNMLTLRVTDAINLISDNRKEFRTILDLYEDNAISKAKTLSLIIKYDPKILLDKKRMKEISNTLEIDEYHIVNSKGIIEYSSEENILNYDLSSNEQSRPFLQGVADKKFQLVQAPMPRGIDNKLFQYIGVARLDADGVVQIGYSPEKYLKISNLYKVTQRFRIGESGMILILRHGRVIDSDNKKFLGKTLSDFDLSSPPEIRELFSVSFDDKEYLCLAESHGDSTIVMGLMPEQEVYYIKNLSMGIFYLFFGVIIILYLLIKKL